MNGRPTRDRLFIRLAKDGTPIPNSAIWRKTKPVGQGRWKDITACVLGCCDPQGSYIIFQGNSLDADTTMLAISGPGYSWSGTFVNGDFMVVPLPYNQATTLTVTVTVDGADLAVIASTITGSGTITADPTLISVDVGVEQTFTVTTTNDPASQYMVTLTDD